MPNKYPKSILWISIFSLWLLWAYAYFNFQFLLTEMEALPHFYGMHLFKEHIRGPIDRFAKVINALKGDNDLENPQDYEALFVEHDLEMMVLFSDLDTPFIVVKLQGEQILYPPGPDFEKVSFLERKDSRIAFFRTLEKIDANDSKGGYFFTDFVDPSNLQGTGRWFLSVAEATEGLYCILLVPEERIKQSGKVLQDAQTALILEKQSRFRMFTLPILIPITILMWLLNSRRKPSQGLPDTQEQV